MFSQGRLARRLVAFLCLEFWLFNFKPEIAGVWKLITSSSWLRLVGFGNLTGILDPVRVSGGKYKVILENEKVRVLKFVSNPGDSVGMHWHPDHLAYAIKNAQRVRFTSDKGVPEELEIKQGTALWVPGGSHAVQNIGDTEIEELIVELKD